MIFLIIYCLLAAVPILFLLLSIALKPFSTIKWSAIWLYSIFAIVSVPFLVLSILLSPALSAYSVIARRKRLPGFLQWFSTVDDDLDGGQRQHPDKYKANATGFRLWWQRTCWICRNPAQGFQAVTFGYSMISSYMEADTEATLWGEIEDLKQRDLWAVKSYVLANGRRIFSYQRNIPIGDRYYIKMWFGWARKTSILRYSLKFVPFSIAAR